MTDVAFIYAVPPCQYTGLINNASHCEKLLEGHGISATVASLTEIGVFDRWISKVQPRVVVIGAPCIKPDSLQALAKKHRSVTWVQRIHSNMAWLQISSKQFQTCLALLDLTKLPNVRYATVSMDEAKRWSSAGLNVIGMPNVYEGAIADTPLPGPEPWDNVRLSAFFAVRLLKNPGAHVLAAATVDRHVRAQGRPRVKLHIQGQRADSPQYIDCVKRLANACDLHLPIEDYRPHDVFVAWLPENIHVGLQLSMTESFNYVAIEHLAAGIPIVTSEAIPFSPWRVQHEDSDHAAVRVIDILRNYRFSSEIALAAAHKLQQHQRREFLKSITSLLEGD